MRKRTLERVAIIGGLALCSLYCDSETKTSIEQPEAMPLEYHTVEELRIGILDGEEDYLFGQIADLAIGAGGNVFIADLQRPDYKIRMFDKKGELIRYVGGSGRGPGEFNMIGGMSTFPDGRLATWDQRNARVNLYSSDGEFIESHIATSGFYSSRVFEVDQEGNFYVKAIFPDPENPGNLADSPKGWMKINAEGEAVDTLMVPKDVEEREQSFVMFTASGGMYPFDIALKENISPLGYIISGINDKYEIFLHKEGGTTVINRDYDPVEVLPEEKKQWQGFKNRFTSAGRDVNVTIPDTKPPYKDILTDSQGRIWVMKYVEAELTDEDYYNAESRWWEPPTYDVFLPDGSFYGTVVLPLNVLYMDAKDDKVWGILRGEQGESYVVRLRLNPGEETQ